MSHSATGVSPTCAALSGSANGRLANHVARPSCSTSRRMAGSVSGGCIEGAVADSAKQTMQTGTPQWLDFGVTNERAWEVGLACGGKLKVFVERLG